MARDVSTPLSYFQKWLPFDIHSEATKQKDFSSNHFDFSFLFFSFSFTQLLILHMRFNLGVLFK
jgi:hypothetical protein